jgi:hypothetical protein
MICRICGTEGETIEHIISSCTVLVQSEYKKRRDIYIFITTTYYYYYYCYVSFFAFFQYYVCMSVLLSVVSRVVAFHLVN